MGLHRGSVANVSAATRHTRLGHVKAVKQENIEENSVGVDLSDREADACSACHSKKRRIQGLPAVVNESLRPSWRGSLFPQDPVKKGVL